MSGRPSGARVWGKGEMLLSLQDSDCQYLRQWLMCAFDSLSYCPSASQAMLST